MNGNFKMRKNNFLYKKIFNSRKILKFAEKNVD